MKRDVGTTESIKVTPYVKDLMVQVTKKLSSETGVTVGINATLRFILERYLNESN